MVAGKFSDKTRKWSMLLTYNIYRLINIALLATLFAVNKYSGVLAILYGSAIGIYLLFAILFFYFWQKHIIKFKQQVLISGVIDIVVMIILISAMGYMQSGVGILLNAIIAMLSILLPGRMAIFFAAIASCILLGVNFFQYEYYSGHNISSFFSTGIYGAGFFATALTALYFANWVRSSEDIARDRTIALKNMQRLNEYIVERLQYGVIYVDPDLKIKVINKAARQFFKPSSEVNLTLPLLSQVLYDEYQKFISIKRAPTKTITLEKPYIQAHFLQASLTKPPAVLIILDDMTVISQQVQQLKLASLGRFSASIAHELRNPLGIISHAVQLMGENEELSKEDERLKQLILNNSNRMNSVIQNVLQVSRRQQAKPQAIKLITFLEEFKRNFCLTNKCEINLNFPDGKNLTVFFDKTQLEQVLVILCENSMQHGKNAEGKVIINISIRDTGQNLVLQLCDMGPGVSIEIRESIFEPFVSSVASGHGMGLFIAKDICEINYAHLTLLESKRGCCFAITFKQKEEINL